MLPFSRQEKQKFDPKRPRLMSICMTTAEVVELFNAILFADHFANWVDEGERQKGLTVS